MRCECCDKELTPAEDSAMFVEADGSKPHRRVGMCGECRSYLDPNTKYVMRKNLPNRPDIEQPDINDPYDLQQYDEDDERW